METICAGSIGMVEEPDERIVHVRICGGDGEVTPCLYPEFNTHEPADVFLAG